jgi:hypothetical protein
MSESKRAFLKQLLSGTTTLTNLQDIVDGAVYVARDDRYTRNGVDITEEQYNARHPSCIAIQVVYVQKPMPLFE